MKKVLSIVLVISLLLSTLAMIGCSKDEEVKSNKENVSTEVNNEDALASGDIFAERAAVDDGLDDELDFEGKTLRVVCHNDGYEMFPAEEAINKGDLIKDAKAARNRAVEDKLNCNIELVYCADITTLAGYVTKSVMSGSNEFDLLVNHVLTSAGMITKQLFINWYDVPYVDFTKPWWAASTSNELTYDGKCILAISDLNATAILCTCIMAFNKNLANSWDLGNLYELVLNGEWTYDAFYSRIKDIYMDSDGSGDRSAGDFYGATLPLASSTNAWLWAFNNPVTSKNEDGVPTITIKTDKINNIVKSVYDLYYNTQGVGSSTDDDFDEYNMFMNKQSIIYDTYIAELTSTNFRNFDDDYGILPFPKWDEYQDKYYSHVYGEHTVSSIPKTAKDLEFIGACVEALSYESWKTLTPTIYEIALKTRYLRDNESKEVLDIILDNRYFDFGFIYKNEFGYTCYNAVKGGNENFESYYNKRFPLEKLSLKKVIKVFDKLS